jgi:hypothetical protein
MRCFLIFLHDRNAANPSSSSKLSLGNYSIYLSAATGHELNLDSDDMTVILAAIRTCDIDDDAGPAGLDIHYYSRTAALHFVDVTNIQCLVGRVKDGSRWAIIDRSGSLAHAVYMGEDED